MPLDDPRKGSWPAGITGESPPDGGDPIAALRTHFEENVGRLGQQIDRAEGELRSLKLQHHAFVAGLQTLAQQDPQTTPEY